MQGIERERERGRGGGAVNRRQRKEAAEWVITKELNKQNAHILLDNVPAFN